MALIGKVLIANRGEIAVRIISSAKKLGIKTVAVFSDADRHAMHVKMADEGYYIGESPASKSYLDMNKLIDIAKKSNAEAIIPGYGFLSENANFAELCESNNITFVGPPSHSIRSMGSKSRSKTIMEEANVPVIKGYHGDNQSPEYLQEMAFDIGYPVLLKAVLGGGGKGMRVVKRPEEFMDCLESAKREAMKSFGDQIMLVEKYLESPRHIEVQVFGDTLGNYVYLFERDCSIQRRHQKVVEEAPAPGLTPELRKKIGEAAVRAAKAVGYVGAGTVEFIFDSKTDLFYFMEMNTRLQVEHPITEMITGEDLVDWQLRVASGFALPKTQEELREPIGHAMEVRVYAENPKNNFLPETGTIKYLEAPHQSFTDYDDLRSRHRKLKQRLGEKIPSTGITGDSQLNLTRIDTSIVKGSEIGVYYDPMISKVISWGPTRDAALTHLIKSLDEYKLIGVENNINFVKRILRNKFFAQGQGIETGFIPRFYDELFAESNKNLPPRDVLSIASSFIMESKTQLPSSTIATFPFRVNSDFNENISFTHNHKTYLLSVTHKSNNTFLVSYSVDGIKEAEPKDEHGSIASFILKNVHITQHEDQTSLKHTISMFLNDDYVTNELFIDKDLSTITLMTSGTEFIHADFTHAPQLLAGDASMDDNANGGVVKSPMTGKIEKIMIKEQQHVKMGDPLIVIEAMKMENTITSPKDGIIKSIFCEVGKVYEHHTILTIFE